MLKRFQTLENSEDSAPLLYTRGDKSQRPAPPARLPFRWSNGSQQLLPGKRCGCEAAHAPQAMTLRCPSTRSSRAVAAASRTSCAGTPRTGTSACRAGWSLARRPPSAAQLCLGPASAPTGFGRAWAGLAGSRRGLAPFPGGDGRCIERPGWTENVGYAIN